MIETVLFDLDGTLLPMDQEEFIRTYFVELIKTTLPPGCTPEDYKKWIWTGTMAMVENDGGSSNREVFFRVFEKLSGLDVKAHEPIFDRFYKQEFDRVKTILGPSFGQREMIAELKAKNYRVILATAPIFPRAAVETRLGWIGLTGQDFDYVTSYENCHYCKPNPEYYREIFTVNNCSAGTSLMIGNNARDDMVAAELGADTFLLTDYLEQTNSEDVGLFRNGKQADLKEFLSALPALEKK